MENSKRKFHHNRLNVWNCISTLTSIEAQTHLVPPMPHTPYTKWIISSHHWSTRFFGQSTFHNQHEPQQAKLQRLRKLSFRFLMLSVSLLGARRTRKSWWTKHHITGNRIWLSAKSDRHCSTNRFIQDSFIRLSLSSWSINSDFFVHMKLANSFLSNFCHQK